MTDDTSQNATPSQGDTSSASAQGATSTSQGETSSTTTTRSAEELERKLAEVMAENAKYRKERRETAEARQAAEEQRLKEQGEFKQLAEKHAARIQELEPTLERYTKLSERIGEQIKAETKDWPDEVKKLVPSASVSIEERLEQVEKLRPLVDKLAGASRASLPGNRPNPTPTGAANQLNSDVARQELLKSGLYKAF